MAGTTTIKLRRKANLAAGLRKLDVLVDGKKIGNIGNDQEEIFEVAPGAHTIQVKLLAKSELINVDLASGSTLALECGITPEFWKRTLLLVANFTLIVLATVVHYEAIITVLTLVIIIVSATWVTYSNFQPSGTYYLKKIEEEASVA